MWLCRHLKLTRQTRFWLRLALAPILKVSLLWGAIGIASAAVGAFFCCRRTAHRWLQFTPGAPNFARIFLIGLSSGVAVALLEETVMRGAMHTAIERESGPWTAALLTAPLFAVLHFFAKARIAPQDVGWGSGFDLLQRSFAAWGQPALVLKRNSNTNDGWPQGAKERCNKSNPLAHPSSCGAMLALAKKCRAANKGAVKRAAVHGPDSRSMAVCMAPRITVSSMSATVIPEPNPTTKMRMKDGAPGVNSAAMMRRCVDNKNKAPTEALAAPIAPHSRLTLTNRRQGKP